MKKPLIATLSTALVIGAASTAFAAANPFSDVPADHWAYDAVAQLAADGIIDGYGDGTYHGRQEITRYEMAQMVAKALAKSGSNPRLDKLSTEFAEELNSLGIRVANLEKKVDNVRFYGEARFTGVRRDVKTNGRKSHDAQVNGSAFTTNKYELRLRADATVNKHWTAKAAFYYYEDNNSKTSVNFGINRVHAMEVQGKYGNTVIDIGRYECTEPITEGLLWDDANTGLRVSTGNKLKFTFEINRLNGNWALSRDWGADRANRRNKAADMLGGSLMYKGKKLTAGLAYYHIGNYDDLLLAFDGEKNANIWAVSASWQFDKNLRLYANYAQNENFSRTGKAVANPNTSGYHLANGKQDKAYQVQLNYKGASLGKPGSWGIYAAYKYLGNAVTTRLTTGDLPQQGDKGWEVGGAVTLAKNVRLHLGYFDGKIIGDNSKVNMLFSRLRFFF